MNIIDLKTSDLYELLALLEDERFVTFFLPILEQEKENLIRQLIVNPCERTAGKIQAIGSVTAIHDNVLKIIQENGLTEDSI